MNSTPAWLWSDCDTPLGRLTLTATERGLSGLFFAGRAPLCAPANHSAERFAEAARQLEQYFDGSRRHFDLPLDLSGGTAFQQSVWRELRSIPYGQTVSYRELAALLGRPDRVRAVGAAVGRTPIPIIVPCHRVIASDGKLTGYVGGLQRKQRLLDIEAAVRQGRGVPAARGEHQLAFAL